eukprot:TRINITY_DN22225_c0_g1_i1.p1 TRINITY_DN22225_c0_g1~~TRINITY_DN22225_c0_g1_i1.p1  ORF type:complete len:1375 (-),score=254.01 TRINITY_DN22225_c0_g1_i1:420-4043(-)
MVMSLFGKLSAHEGENCPDELLIESCIDGNLCRCTGYRSILSAFKSFAGTPKEQVAGEKFAPFPDFLKQQQTGPKVFMGSDKEWISPASLEELCEIISTQSARSDGKKMSLVAGHTCRGIYKDDHLVDVFVDVSRVPELMVTEVSSDGIKLGAAVTWGMLIKTLEGVTDSSKPEMGALPVLIEHAYKVAGHSVRNLGTLGGNLVMTKRRGFASDLATILAGVGASITIVSSGEGPKVPSKVALETFFSSSFKLSHDAIVTDVLIPYLAAGELFRSYRTAVRPVNSHALTNAAFRAKMEGGKIVSARLVFGALGSNETLPGPSDPETSEGAFGGPVRAPKAEQVMVGNAPDVGTLRSALDALSKEEWWPEDEFERHLSSSYLYKMFHTLAGSDVEKAPPLGVSLSSERPASKGTQLVGWATPDMAPIAEPMPKLSSKLQAAGEQTYTSDLPEPRDILYAAYVVVPRAKAVLVDADLTAAEKMPGVFRIFDSTVIPGKNICELTQSHRLLLPKGEPSQFAGQPCHIVLADSTRRAEAAAKAVRLTLETPGENPVLTTCRAREVQQAADDGQRELPSPIITKGATVVQRGDAAAALAAAPHKVKGELFCDGQKAFYMEPPASLAIPGEGGTLTVWGSFQVPSWVHGVVADATGKTKNQIVMNATHIGGGFGGKLFKSTHVVCAASVCAMATQRAVKFAINRNVETAMCGGRLSMDFEYEVGFDDSGKLAAIQAKIYTDKGLGDGCSGFSTGIAVKNMEQIYGIPNLDVEGIMCTTDKPGNTAIRGPGEPQATFLIESIIEHVAAELGKDAQEVREANIFTSPADVKIVAANPTSKEVEKYSAMLAIDPEKDAAGRPYGSLGFPAVGIWAMLKQKVDFDAKAAAVAKFNSEHRWRKRGLAMTPVRYCVSSRAQQALVCLYTDGTCLITCDGTEIGQGLHTKMIQFAAYYLSQIVPGCDVPVSAIRVGPNGTDKVAHGSITGGSTTSEGVCEAIRDAIEKIAEMLKPTKEKMSAAGKNVTFAGLLEAASGNTELQASGKNKKTLEYFCYGAAASEVEVDVLTGETTVLSTSILYDCGKSLNPTIDLGQCEGAFMMGLGFFLRERLITNPMTGAMATDGTWEYKIPCFQDVPLQFDVEFFPRAFTEGASVLSSKASGEPPLVLSSSVFCAVKQAIRAGRKEFGKGSGNFRLDAPCTPRDIALAIGAVSEKMDI